MIVGIAVIYKALHKGDVNYRLTGVKHITVSLVAFSRFACVHSCKEISLLRISRFALLKKATEKLFDLQINNFLRGRSRRMQ